MILNEFIFQYITDIVEGGEHFGIAVDDGDSVLVMRRRLAVASTACPTVGFYNDIAATHVDHRLDAQAHSVFDNRADAPAPVVGYFRVFVHAFTYAMPAHFADYAIATFFAIGLNGVGNVADAFAGYTGFDAYGKRLFGGAA